MKIHDALEYIRSNLQLQNGVYAVHQAKEILEALLKCSRTELYLCVNRSLSPEMVKTIQEIVERRLNNEPLQYILGHVYFYSREFKITPDVLIPRPDTETLVEQVLRYEKKKECRFADIGTGSGIISCILTEENPGWQSFAIDISYKSLLVAKSNIRSKVHLLCGNVLDSINPLHKFDFIVSNPPYISDDEIQTLDPDVKDFEPYHALCGGADGLWFYRYFAQHAYKWITSSGCIFCETGYNQEQKIVELFHDNGWRDIHIFKDNGGNPRVLRALVPENTVNDQKYSI